MAALKKIMIKQGGALSPKLMLSLLIVMFIIPLTVAWLMHSDVVTYRPGTSVNRGILIDPPVSAELPQQFHESGLAEHWTITRFLPANCDAGCRERLLGLRQVHRALGRDATRTRILLLADNASGNQANEAFLTKIEEPGSSFSVITSNTGKLSQQFELLGDRDGIFIVDPLGNIMMRYAPDTDPNDILFDMERLLKYQKTDPQ